MFLGHKTHLFRTVDHDSHSTHRAPEAFWQKGLWWLIRDQGVASFLFTIGVGIVLY